jgi:hypothetical protein
MKILTLKFPATCADKNCGAALPAGTRAKWYGRGRVYGLDCHERPEGAGRSARSVVSTRCEDYPCCGHGPAPQGDGGGCPTTYSDGSQTFACCGCGGRLPKNSSSSLCARCLRRSDSLHDDDASLDHDFSMNG